MHVVGLLWTTDLAQGWNDIRIKLPILVLTLIIAGNEPLTKKQFHLVLSCFIAAVFIGTMASMAVLTGIIHRELKDIRDVFIFKISHIRFGLFTCIAIYTILYFIFIEKPKNKLPLQLFLAGVALWLMTFLFIVESLTGVLISSTIMLILAIIYFSKRLKTKTRTAFIIAMSALPIIFLFFLIKAYMENYSPRLVFIDQYAKTEQGNNYTFNLDNPEMENGYPAYVYMCEEELRRSWNRRSIINFDSTDIKMQPIKFTLMRFLASKGLRKDSVAMTHLTDEEIHSIEKGIPNINYQSPSIKVRLMQVIWEMDQSIRGGDPNGHSIMQRLESWKASLEVIPENILLGVGTGDLPAAVHDQYSLMNSKLNSDHYLRSHNQYLAITVAFGITGLAYFLFALSYPIIFLYERKNFIYLLFFLTLILSMLTEDTLETQPGATFFAFFNALFLFAKPDGANNKKFRPDCYRDHE